MSLVIFLIVASTTTSTTAELAIPLNRTCSNLIVQDPTLHTTLDIFFTTLVARSNSTNFQQANIINTATSVNGLYQCSANVSHADCQTCVKKLTSIIPRPCNTATAKLVDCYMTYEVIRNQFIHSDGGKDYGVCIGAFVASVVATVVSISLQS